MRLLKGLITELRPLPVIAIMLSTYLAFLFAAVPITTPVLLYFPCIFFLLYTVHFLDTYEDSYVRKEDHLKTFIFAHGSSGLKKEELLAGAFVSSVIFLSIVLSLQNGVFFIILNLAAFILGISYSHYLSRNIILALLATPVGVLLAMTGIYMLATGAADLRIVVFSLPVCLLFLGASAWMEMADSDTDRKTGKPNIGLSLGTESAKRLGFLSLLGGLILTVIGYPQFLVSMAAVCLIFCLGFVSTPKKGVYYVLGGIFLFLLVRIYLAAR